MEMMEGFLTVLKGSLDPLFVVFVLLALSFVIFFRTVKKKSDSLLLLFCIVLIYGASIAPVANYLCYYLERDYIFSPHAPMNYPIDAIVVLGNGTKTILSVKETFNTNIGSLRTLRAVEVYRQTNAAHFVCSGRGDGQLSEAEVMARTARALGVPGEKIKIGPDARNTAENAGDVKKMLGDKRIRIGLVTSAFHMKRSERELKKYFEHVTPIPAHYLYSSPTGNPVVRYMPQSAELHKTSIAVKEIIAQWVYRLK